MRDTLFVNLFNDYPFLDKSIYNPNKLFRLPLCTKNGQQRYLIITSNHTFNDALLTFIDESSQFVDAYTYEKPKKERIPKVEKKFIEQITDILKTKYNDDTSEYCHAYSKLPETYYFKTHGERTCPHGIKHEQDNFITNYNIEKASLTYV